MGGLRKKMPITFGTFLIATLAISGVPGFSGFYSQGRDPRRGARIRHEEQRPAAT